MSEVDDQIREIQLSMLEDMKKRRDVLDQGIANLEYAIDNPNPHYEIDFKAIEEESRRSDMEQDTKAVKSFISRKADSRLCIGTYYEMFREGIGWRLPNESDYKR